MPSSLRSRPPRARRPAGWSLALATALTAALAQPGHAVVEPKGFEPQVTAGAPARTHRATRWARPGAFDAAGLPGWTAIVDHDTGVPLRLWGAGLAAPGAVRDPALAEAAARRFLGAHLALLAPGAQATDLVVVANQLDPTGTIRSVGFAQHAGGLRVVGGAVSVSFKADRLVMAGSTALPGVPAPAAAPAADAAALGQAAVAWLAADGHRVTARPAAPARVILPIVRARGAGGAPGPAITYAVADQLVVEAVPGEVGRWDVWLDATTRRPLARRSTIAFAQGRVLYDVPVRSPVGGREPRPAPDAWHTVNGAQALSTADGAVTWADGPATVEPGLQGPLITVINAAGELATDTLALVDGGEAIWSRATEEPADAQLSAFVHASAAKAFAREHFAPDLPWLGRALEVHVNESQTCNAFSTGDDIHFFRRSTGNSVSSPSCENTARLADVVYHEFGHSLHANSVIEGVGAFEGALSEGVSDMLAAFMTRDAGMGRGFFLTNAPLRNLDPATPRRWPDDVTGQVHQDGQIIGGALWDLRAALIAKLGEAAGDERARRIYYGILQRASDIPSSYAEALVTDDDDGDLANGTPNLCEINAAFGAHGLADPRLTIGLGAPVRDGRTLSIAATPPATTAACPGPAITEVVASWRVRGQGSATSLALAPTADGLAFAAELPPQRSGTVVEYQLAVTLADGTVARFPANPADPYYEAYFGEVEPLWCASFEDGFAGWTHGASPSTRDEWEVGAPRGLGGDPAAAHGGQGVLGIDLSDDGVYRRGVSTWAESPPIDLAGHTAVRLQYYRWLGVEDGFYDRARVLANGHEVWASYASQSEDAATVHHTDREWRFQDVDLSARAGDGTLRLRFDLASDQGFQLGGWTVDDVCVVVAKPAPACELEGDCEDAEAGGCCDAGGRPEGALALALGTLALVLAPRRRRR